MGKMKQLYMEIDEYYEGAIPEKLAITEYLQKRRKENEEWEQYEKEANGNESNQTKETGESSLERSK